MKLELERQKLIYSKAIWQIYYQHQISLWRQPLRQSVITSKIITRSLLTGN